MATNSFPVSTISLQAIAISLFDNTTSFVPEAVTNNSDFAIDTMNGTGYTNATTSVTKTTSYRYLYYGIYAIIMIPTIFGNLLILTSIVRFKNLRRNMHILIGNLAVADLLVGIVVIPFDIIGDAYPIIKTYKFVCLTDYSIAGFTLFYSSVSLFLISIERFIAVVFPIKHLQFDKRKLFILITIGLGFSLVYSSIPFVWNNYVGMLPLPCFTEIVWTESYRRILQFIWFFLVLISLLLYCVVFRVALKMRSRRPTENKSNLQADRSLKGMAKEKKTSGKPRENKMTPKHKLHKSGTPILKDDATASLAVGDAQLNVFDDKNKMQANETAFSTVSKSTMENGKKLNTEKPEKLLVGKSSKTIRRTKMMVAVLVIFAICWSPYLIVNTTLTFYKSALLQFLQKWLLGLGMLNSGMNWIIYSFSNREFKEAFAGVLKCRRKAS